MRNYDKIDLSGPEEKPTAFYSSLLKTIRNGSVPVLRGHNGFYYLNKIRDKLDHLVILQVSPKSVSEVKEHAKMLKRDKKNLAIIDLRWIPGEYGNPFEDGENKYVIYDTRSLLWKNEDTRR